MTGQCAICGAGITKAAMTNHLRSCRLKVAKTEMPPGGRKPKVGTAFHLLVEGRYLPQYWMHLEIPAKATLADLDSFLRKTWLECCGHLSVFKIFDFIYDIAGDGDENMDVALQDVLAKGLRFYHDYDFGTTTKLALKVLGEWEAEIKGKTIRILSRNDPPPIVCEVCGKPATQVCGECIYDDAGWLCDKCARKHECGEDVLLPVVNSPRVGMCGYTG